MPSLVIGMPPAEGFDPYDALRGARIPGFVKKSWPLRQAAIQERKRGLIGPRALGIHPFVMAKTLGCHLTALSRFAACGSEEALELAVGVAGRLQDEPGIGRCAGGGWGYEFDVQTRWSYYPQGEPNAIVTFFVGRALLGAAEVLGDPGCLEEARAAACFMIDRLLCESGFFRYTTTSDVLVHNANLLAASLVSAIGVVTRDRSFVRTASRAARLSLAAQAPDGSWEYGMSPNLGWIDSFHTAYNLDALALLKACGVEEAGTALTAGSNFWLM